MAYCSLHNHTYASNIRMLDSINRPKDMVKRAIELGITGMAFTDHECLSAAVSVLKIRDAIKEEHPDFKFIFGNEIYLIDEKDVGETTKFYHFILLALDEVGWGQLRELSSRAWKRAYSFKGLTRVPTTYKDIEEVVGSNPGHIFASSACLGGEIPCNILAHEVHRTNEMIRWCINTFGQDNFALELQPSDSEEQITVNPILIKLANHYAIPYIITTDSHYLCKDDFAIHSAFLNSKQSSDRETEKFYKFTYVMAEDEIYEILRLGGLSDEQIAQGLKNTLDVQNRVQDYDFRHSTIVPALHLPPFELKHLLADYYDKYPLIKHYAYSKYEQDRYLMYQIEKGLIEKKVVIDEEKLARINTELDVVLYISKQIKQDVSAYLNLAVNMIDIAWQVSLVGCGRGSACGFYINYLIGITQVDPLPYGLPYWRFLNKERAEMPDIDSDYQPEKIGDMTELFREAYGEDNVLNCATFKTESLKSAILTCARGLGINNDEAQGLAALVPSHRGKTYTLSDCLNGNEEQGFDPVPNFREKLEAYPRLFEAVQMIEGLPTNASIHASALYIFNNGYLEHNSLMRAPNKTLITAFNMHDSDDQGALKMDVLRTDAQSKMAKCMDLLLKAGEMEWKGSLRATYNYYLHPDVLDYTSPEMWEKAASGEIANLFQFETQVGSVCIKKARPTNVMQLAEINSIMRLQVEGDEQPIDRYVRFRDNIDVWYLEMVEEGLNQSEIDVLRKYLDKSFGISGSQETLMLLVMDPQITGFTLGEANKFRKAIAKKIAADIQENKEKYFKYGKKLGTRQVFLDYVWKYCVEPQLGYSFSLNHTLPYSVIAVQEMNLATRWNPLYWQCACLCINAGNYTTDLDTEDTAEDEEEEDESEEVVEEETPEKKEKRVAPNYGKIAKAISDAQLSGVRVELPDINTSQADFIPDVENNAILYSLQAINVVNPELMDRIIKNRPYTSIDDFWDKVQPEKGQMIGLIKAGCFDKLYNEPRSRIMHRFLYKLAEELHPKKDVLTKTHMMKSIDLGLNLEKYKDVIRIYKFKKYLDKNCRDTESKVRRFKFNDETCVRFFNTFIKGHLNMSKDEYGYLDDFIIVKEASFNKYVEQVLSDLMTYLNSPEGLNEYHKLEVENEISSLEEKYATGTPASWEMETMCFYHEPHELANLNNILYNVKDFETLEEYPTPRKITTKTGLERDVYDLCCVAGTVIANNNTKHTVTILTKYGVITLKLFAQLYTDFNQKFSTMDPNKPKTKIVIDDSWFKRGKLIIAYGYRRENMFNVRTDRTEGYPRSIGLIERINTDGTASIRYARKKRLDK